LPNAPLAFVSPDHSGDAIDFACLCFVCIRFADVRSHNCVWISPRRDSIARYFTAPVSAADT
jgi:hypothetical protein